MVDPRFLVVLRKDARRPSYVKYFSVSAMVSVIACERLGLEKASKGSRERCVAQRRAEMVARRRSQVSCVLQRLACHISDPGSLAYE